MNDINWRTDIFSPKLHDCVGEGRATGFGKDQLSVKAFGFPHFATPNSNAPRSGALPLKGRPTSTPLSMASLPAFSFMKGTTGKSPLDWRGLTRSAWSRLWKSLSD